MKPRLFGLVAAVSCLAATEARAEKRDADFEQGVRLHGYVEAFYSYNANRPSNRVSAYRDFDNRTDTFAVQNAEIEALARVGDAYGKIALQYGLVPTTYYQKSDRFLLPIQEAYGAWRASEALRIEAGLFLSPLGFEDMAVKDEWNWSRSAVWTALPTYQLGARARLAASNTTRLEIGVWNGWNAAVDNNAGKSISLSYTYAPTDAVELTAMYFGGPERDSGAREGPAWRQLVDLAVQARVLPWLELVAYTDDGLEPNRFGLSGWASGVLYARIRATSWLYAAGRSEVLFEKAATNANGTAAPIFWPSRRFDAQTFTIDMRPAERVSIRLEYRHDGAASPLFFQGFVANDAHGVPIATARTQTTTTLGATTWF